MIVTSNHRPLAPSLNEQQGGYVHDAIATLTFGKLGWLSFRFPANPTPHPKAETMKRILCLAGVMPTAGPTVLRSASPLSGPLASSLSNPLANPQTQGKYGTGPRNFERGCAKEDLRHILLGSPGAIRQTIHLLHSLRYAEPVLWSPIMTVGKQMIITPEQGESMSLLRRSL